MLGVFTDQQEGQYGWSLGGKRQTGKRGGWGKGGVCVSKADNASLVGFDKESKFIFISVEGHYRMKGLSRGVARSE